MNLFWLLVALGACPAGVTWAHGREVTAATWRAASARRGWVAGRLSGSGYGYYGYGGCSGSGYYGTVAGDGYGYGGGAGDGYSGYGYGYGDGSGGGGGDGGGAGYYGYGYDYGDGDGSGYGYGSGSGDGDGDGYDSLAHKDIISVEFDNGLKLTDGEGISTSAELIVGRALDEFCASNPYRTKAENP